MKKIWTKERVISEIKSLQKKGMPLNERRVLFNRNDLRCGARKAFGIWKEALRASGLNPTAIINEAKSKHIESIKKWTKPQIIKTLNQLKNKNTQIHMSNLRKIGQGSLVFASIREFGSFDKTLMKAGLNPKEIRGDKNFKQWGKNPKRILTEIRKLYKAGYELNASSIKSSHLTLYWAAGKYYGSWYSAIKAAGLDVEKYRCDRDREADKGNIFENLCFELFAILKPHWKTGCFFECGKHTAFPDMVDQKTNEWIDFKIRPHGESAEKSIVKYSAYAQKLRIIYLLGKRKSFDNIKFASILKYQRKSQPRKVKQIFKRIIELKKYDPTLLHLEKWAKKWSKAKITKWIKKQPIDSLNEKNVMENYNELRCAASTP